MNAIKRLKKLVDNIDLELLEIAHQINVVAEAYEWRPTYDAPLSVEGKVLAWDNVGKTVGIWDGYNFDSITGDYSFDAEYSKGMHFYREGTDTLVGHITHYMLLPGKPPR